MKLVEQREGQGQLTVRGTPVGSVDYSISRFQAMTPAGLPVPGLHRIEGRLGLERLSETCDLDRDMHLALQLEDGRRIELILLDTDGRVLSEGHGPGQCGCC
jgi:hypothetical protein